MAPGTEAGSTPTPLSPSSLPPMSRNCAKQWWEGGEEKADGRPLPTKKRWRTASKVCAPHILTAAYAPHFHLPLTWCSITKGLNLKECEHWIDIQKCKHNHRNCPGRKTPTERERERERERETDRERERERERERDRQTHTHEVSWSGGYRHSQHVACSLCENAVSVRTVCC